MAWVTCHVIRDVDPAAVLSLNYKIQPNILENFLNTDLQIIYMNKMTKTKYQIVLFGVFK